MRIMETQVFKFDELAENIQEKVIERMYDCNVDCDWWDCTYDDASMIGLKIKAFDIDRGSYCKAEFVDSAYDVAKNIIDNHGEKCETYTDSINFIQDYDALVKKYSDGVNTELVTDENHDEFDERYEDIAGDFLKKLQEDYRIILQKEYEYLTSREAIIETIKCNEYEFTIDGKMV